MLLRAPAGDAQVSREDLLSVLGCGPESWCKAAGASVTQEGFSSWIETNLWELILSNLILTIGGSISKLVNLIKSMTFGDT